MTSNVDASVASTSADEIYQFKIALKYIKPPIWRRIQVPANFTFFDLHVAIEDLFQWSGIHLHKFEMVKPKRIFSRFDDSFELDSYIGIPDRSMADLINILPEKETKIADQFSIIRNRCLYVYDFGSEWVSFFFLHSPKHSSDIIDFGLRNQCSSYRDTLLRWSKFPLHYPTSSIRYASKVKHLLFVTVRAVSWK